MGDAMMSTVAAIRLVLVDNSTDRDAMRGAATVFVPMDHPLLRLMEEASEVLAGVLTVSTRSSGTRFETCEMSDEKDQERWQSMTDSQRRLYESVHLCVHASKGMRTMADVSGRIVTVLATELVVRMVWGSLVNAKLCDACKSLSDTLADDLVAGFAALHDDEIVRNIYDDLSDGFNAVPSDRDS